MVGELGEYLVGRGVIPRVECGGGSVEALLVAGDEPVRPRRERDAEAGQNHPEEYGYAHGAFTIADESFATQNGGARAVP